VLSTINLARVVRLSRGLVRGGHNLWQRAMLDSGQAEYGHGDKHIVHNYEFARFVTRKYLLIQLCDSIQSNV